VLFDVAYQSYLPSLVERAQLAEGNSKLEVTRSGAQIGGPGVAGVLIGVLTAPFAVVLDAASFAVSALLITRINGHEVVERVASASRSMRREIAEGLRFVLSHPYMRPSLSYVAISNFFTSGLFAIFLVYAVRNLGMSAAQAGLIFSIGHVGNLAGAVGRSSGRGAPRDRTDHHRCRCARQLGVPPYTSRPRLNA
jgi:hypothetical protein